MADKLIDIFGEDFASVLASLDDLPPQVETMLMGVMDKMVYDVRTFSNALEKTVFSMSQSGVSSDIIKQTLANDMNQGGRIFGQLRNETKASIVDGINQSAKMGQYENYDLDKGTFAWVTVGGHRVCMDCDGRAGMTLTFNEWESEGLPGSGWSVCQGYCYCVLDPTGQISKKVNAPVREKGSKVAKKTIPTITKTQADQLAMRFFNMAKKQDPQITSLAKNLADETGSALHGLDHRLKTPRSISRKIIKDSVEDGISYSRMAKDDLSDINRFTFILDEVSYVDDYNNIIGKFLDEGYELAKVKNYWDGVEYRGLNVNLKALDGRKIEMQFNTKRSQFIKDKYSHKWYEEARDLKTTAKRKAEIRKLAAEKWNTVDKPKGWDEIDLYPPKTLKAKAPKPKIKLKETGTFSTRQKTIEQNILNKTKNKIENGTIYDKNGNILAEIPGNANSIKVTKKELELLSENIITHNHPNSSPFSLTDILVGSEGSALEVRAIAPDSVYGKVTYYIKPKKGQGWPSKTDINRLHDKYFRRDYNWKQNVIDDFEIRNPKLMSQLDELNDFGADIQKKFKAGDIDRLEYNKQAKQFNSGIRKWKKIWEIKANQHEFFYVSEKMKEFADELNLEFGWESW